MRGLLGSTWFWFVLPAGVLIALRIVLVLIRWNQRRDDPGNYDLDLADLQQLLANGQMTQEEFEKARAVILSRTDASHEPVKGFPVLAPPKQRKS
jgi:uncharacterized membrane protein